MPLIALTFDDGPNTVITPQVLDILEKEGILASFFLIAQNITPESAAVARRAYDMGCDIENHTLTHPFMDKMSAEEINQEVPACTDKIIEITGEAPKFFRPPFIAVKKEMYDNIDMTFICGVGCEVYAVSTDTHFVHKAWHDASERIRKINYPMLADPTHALSCDFQVLIESDGMAERGTFIINPEGKIVGYEVTAGNVGRNAEELFRKVQACQFVHAHGDQVCPANWTPGAETLKPSLDLVGQL